MKRLFSILLLLAATQLGAFGNFESAFVPGEVSEYKVRWVGIPVAWSRTTTEAFTENGKKLIRIRMISKSYAAYNAVYKVDDLTEVVVDPQTALPLSLKLILNEGGRHKNHFTIFDHKNATAQFHDHVTGETKIIQIAPDTRDVLTFLYSARNMDVKALTAQPHKIYVDGKIYDMELRLRGEETVKLSNYGKIKCTEFEPIAEFDGLFIREGKISCLISKVERRMIACITTKVAIGTITVKLEDLSGPGDDFWIIGKKD